MVEILYPIIVLGIVILITILYKHAENRIKNDSKRS